MYLERKKYTADFKRMVVDEFLTSGQSMATLEKKYAIGASCLCRWVRELEQHQMEAFPGLGQRHASADELAALQRQVKNLSEQNAILKKALQLVAQNPESATR